MTNKADAEDIAQEAFLKVAAAMGRGNGPDVVFRPYLLRTVRTAAADRWNEQAKETPMANTGDSPVEDASLAAVLHRDNPELVMKAFQSLPVRWMTVLWHAEVEREPPRRIAPVLGMEPGAVSALLLRARKGLREAYLSEYAAAPPRTECEPTFPYLAATVLGTNSARDRRKVKEHTRDCEDCAKVLAELSDVGATMRVILAPMLLIPSGALLPDVKLLPEPKSGASPYGVGLTAAAITVTIAAVAAVGNLALSVDTLAVPVVSPAPSSVSETAPTQQFIPTSGATTAPRSLSEEPVAAEAPASVNGYRPNEPIPGPLGAGQPAIAAQFRSPAASFPAAGATAAGNGPSTTPTSTAARTSIPTAAPAPIPTAVPTPAEPVPVPSPTPTVTPTSSPTSTPTPTPTDPPTEPDCIVILIFCVSG